VSAEVSSCIGPDSEGSGAAPKPTWKWFEIGMSIHVGLEAARARKFFPTDFAVVHFGFLFFDQCIGSIGFKR